MNTPDSRARRGSLLALTVSLILLSGCTVGPDYRGAPQVSAGHDNAFVRAPSAGLSTTPAPSQWWKTLNDPQLDALIDAALANNQNLKAAQARLRQSREQLQQQRTKALPSLSVDAAAVRVREPDTSLLSSSSGNDSTQNGQSSGSSGGHGRGPLQLYTAGFDASWELDLFGGTRRATESASAQAEAVEADLADTQVQLAAEVAQAYIDLRDQQQRLVLAHQSTELAQKTLALVQQRRERGTASDADVERQNTQVENTRATLIPLDEQITESMDQLAVLTGQAPGALDRELSAPASLPAMPATVAVDDPATMLRQRPDIRAAERRLASGNAQIGQHTADLFPKVTLMGYLGSTGINPRDLAKKSAVTWLGVPYLQWNVFDFGRVRSSIRQAEAGRDELAAQYTQTVLAALQDANNALSRYGHQRESVTRLTQIETSANRSENLMHQRYSAGASSLIDLMDAQRTQFSAQQNRIEGQASLLKDFVSLQKSLGLGWQ
ncbi:efflux transporter outer membrane subunit [Dyella telluris]|uniref:Efflux transporter outer membrane subunit n=1 Tax=Dyella telluris TaxID=2763498 RepID=A0A7G8Q3Q3_9GAMM|nr:efflux transporter outer membrane subunit [Dyella telluris]QNK01411.1 efflux transporter outer membrane subunit [Dyella telluris]